MARSRKGDGAVAALILLGVVGWLAQHPAVLVLIVVAVVVALAIHASQSRICETCGVALKRTVYRWQIDGVSKRVCPNCNRTLERRQSNRALGAP